MRPFLHDAFQTHESLPITWCIDAAPNCSFFLGSFVLLHHAIEVKLAAARPNKHDLALEFSIAKKTKDQNKQPDNKLLWNIGGSTGGFTRAVLYNWTPPDLNEDLQ